MSDPQNTNDSPIPESYTPQISDPQNTSSTAPTQPAQPAQPSFTLPAPTGAPQTAPAKKQSPFIKIGLGCLGLLVLGCLGIGGFVFFQLQQQQQAYESGHKAYLAGDCATAIPAFTKAADGIDDDLKVSAKAEMQECEALNDVDAQVAAGDPSEGIFSYIDFMDKYTDSPLAAIALKKAQDTLNAAKPDTLATVKVCESIDSLVKNKVIAAPDTTLPGLLFACGQTYEKEARWTDAVNIYTRFRQDYADHELAAQVKDAYVRATLAEAQNLGAGELPPPQATGSGSGEGDVTVIIQNDSPEALSIVFSGPDTRVEEIERCTKCESFSGTNTTGCPELGPIGTYKIKPGSYEVVVKASSDTSVTPFKGTWELGPGEEYSSCFYLVTSP